MAQDMEHLDHTCTDEVVCPHCGYEFSDSWEFDDEVKEMDCPECGGYFSMIRDVRVTYDTSPIKK